MKVVFPCTGALILLKKDLNTLKDFYYNSLTSHDQLYSYYNATGSPVQIGSLNYPPSKSNLVLYKTELLTINKMRKILSDFEQEQNHNAQPNKQTVNTNAKSSINKEEKFSDSDIRNNPFFTTLQRID